MSISLQFPFSHIIFCLNNLLVGMFCKDGCALGVPYPPLDDPSFGLPDRQGVIYGGWLYIVCHTKYKGAMKKNKPRSGGVISDGGHIRGGGGET